LLFERISPPAAKAMIVMIIIAAARDLFIVLSYGGRLILALISCVWFWVFSLVSFVPGVGFVMLARRFLGSVLVK
jgi:hypothetical protein